MNMPNNSGSIASDGSPVNVYFDLEFPVSPFDEKTSMTVLERIKAAESPSSLMPPVAPQLKKSESRSSVGGKTGTPLGSRSTRNLLSGGQIVRHVLPLIYQLLDTKMESVNLWTVLLTFRDVLERIPADVVKREIVPYAVNKGNVSQPSLQRMVCCHLLGHIAERRLLSTEEIDTASNASAKSNASFFSVAMALCQDTDFKVRTCMCRQLNQIARNAGTRKCPTTDGWFLRHGQPPHPAAHCSHIHSSPLIPHPSPPSKPTHNSHFLAL
jgi:hypothetical protein